MRLITQCEPILTHRVKVILQKQPCLYKICFIIVAQKFWANIHIWTYIIIIIIIIIIISIIIIIIIIISIIIIIIISKLGLNCRNGFSLLTLFSSAA